MPKLDNTVVLRGIVTDLDSPEGRRFVVDCTRAGEGLFEDRELVEIYEISAKDWEAATENRALANAIRDERARRLRNGVAAREAAAKEFIKAPAVLGGILNDQSANAKHRIDSARELRATAHGGGMERTADAGEKFYHYDQLGRGSY